MRKLLGGLLIFIAGLGLGWYAHERWAPESETPQTLPTSPQQAPASQTLPDLSSPPQDEISRLLEAHAFQDLLDQYDTLQRDGHYNDARKIRTRLLIHANQLIAEDTIDPAIQLLQLYLATQYRDSEAHTLLAEAQYKQGDTIRAINTLYEAKGHAYRSKIVDQITNRIRAMVAEQVDLLNTDKDYDQLLELFQHLTQLEPSHAPYFIGLASTQISLNDTEAARRSLQLVEYNPEVAAQVQTLLAIIDKKDEKENKDKQAPADHQAESTEMTTVPLQRNGNSFLVDTVLNRVQGIRLLIDTGASLTILTPAILENSAVPLRDTGKTALFNTANGKVRAPIYVVDSLAIGDWQVVDLEVGILALDDASGVDGLLGMNFLKHFQFYIDQTQGVLQLSVNNPGGADR